MNRKWLPSFVDLIDRQSIFQLKEVMIPQNKDVYAQEMKNISHDLSQIIEENQLKWSGEVVSAIIALAQVNAHIWYNESKVRSGEEQDLSLLKLTHGLNGIRNRLMNFIKFKTGESDRIDLKTDCLAAEFKDWEYSVLNPDQEEP